MIKDPQHLAIWMYEHQGPQRFGSDNRFFVVLVDKENLENSWKLKRDFNFIFSKIDNTKRTSTQTFINKLLTKNSYKNIRK